MSIGSVCQCQLLKLIEPSCWRVVVVDVTHGYCADALQWHGDNTSRRCRWQSRTPRRHEACHVAVCSRNSTVLRVTCVRETPVNSAGWTPSRIGSTGMDVLLHRTHQLSLSIHTTRLDRVTMSKMSAVPSSVTKKFMHFSSSPVFKALLSHQKFARSRVLAGTRVRGLLRGSEVSPSVDRPPGSGTVCRLHYEHQSCYRTLSYVTLKAAVLVRQSPLRSSTLFRRRIKIHWFTQLKTPLEIFCFSKKSTRKGLDGWGGKMRGGKGMEGKEKEGKGRVKERRWGEAPPNQIYARHQVLRDVNAQETFTAETQLDLSLFCTIVSESNFALK